VGFGGVLLFCCRREDCSAGFGDVAAVSMCGKNCVCVCWERTKKKKVGVERGPSGAAPGLTFSADSGCRPIRAGVGANCLACGVPQSGTMASENLQPSTTHTAQSHHLTIRARRSHEKEWWSLVGLTMV